MKTAKILLIGMYLQLILNIAVPASIIFLGFNGGNIPDAQWLLKFYLVTAAAVVTLGWICVAMAIAAYRKGRYDLIIKSLKLLKFGTIPFYVLCFFYGFFLAWLPLLINGILIIQSGCIGACYVRYLRKRPGNMPSEGAGRPSGIHYVMQFLSVLDIVSTAILLKWDHRERKARLLHWLSQR